MTESIHELLRDRMPEVARGSARWNATDQTHLASCADCGAEWELIQAAMGVGALIEREFDAIAAAQLVSAKLHHERQLVRRPVVHALVGLAAAAAITLVLLRPTTAPPQPRQVVEGRLFPELDSLNVEELSIIADGLNAPLAETPLGAPQTLDQLDSTELTRVLRALEG